MKSKFESLLKQLNSAFVKFQEIMSLEKSEIVRDSAIQRFEFTYELAWKTMKASLEEKGEREIYSPKEVIRGAFRERIVDNDPTWLDMVKTRNKTSHIYSEAMAEEVYAELPKYLPIIKKLIDRLA